MAKAKQNITAAKPDEAIIRKIYFIRDQKVMLDFHLAALYEVETRRLNEQVKRNISRFPQDFMFRLTAKEWQMMRSQFATASLQNKDYQLVETMVSQNATASKKRNTTITPYAFTEHGVTMLASVLKSERAVKMSIAVVRAFIELQKTALQFKEFAEQLETVKQHLGEHDEQLNSIYKAIENLLDNTEKNKNWESRKRIGFKSDE